MNLTEEQHRAVLAASEYVTGKPNEKGYFAIGGAAGTGKTTCEKELLGLLQDEGLTPIPCAFTGKAASVMRSKGVFDAQTIHSAIYEYDPEADRGLGRFYLKGKEVLADADYFLVDEASMVGSQLFRDMLSFKLPIIAIGDHYQLPPIGDRETLRSLVSKPDTVLETIHRQALDSPVLRMATDIRLGKPLPLPRPMSEGAKYTESADVDIWLCGMNRTRLALNAGIRQIKGFAAPDGPGRVFQISDRVVCLVNDPSLGVFNGMRGEVIEVSEGFDRHPYERCLVAWEGEEDRPEPQRWINLSTAVPFGEKQDNSLRYECRGHAAIGDYGYALTVHKAQGSEWDHVAVAVERWDAAWDPRRWLYTAVTRARESVALFA